MEVQIDWKAEAYTHLQAAYAIFREHSDDSFAYEAYNDLQTIMDSFDDGLYEPEEEEDNT